MYHVQKSVRLSIIITKKKSSSAKLGFVKFQKLKVTFDI